MSVGTIAAASVALLVWALASARLDRADITGPMALVALGTLADLTGVVDLNPDDAPLSVLAQAALALLLFSDAARVNVARLRHDVGPPARLLGIGLPLTLALGTLAAQVVEPALGWAAAFLVAACLAPTDAGLGAVVVSDPKVPRRIRRTLNVESGLNDGIAAPVVSLGIALVAEADFGATGLITDALGELGIGIGVGVAVGLGGGWLLRGCRARRWMLPDAVPLAVLGLAVAADTGAIVAGGNGFIGAFVAGLAFGPFVASMRDGADPAQERHAPSTENGPLGLTELGGQVAGSVVWFLFGAALTVPVVTDADWRTLAYAVASLTVVRMLPVAVSLLGSGLTPVTVGFLAWFGPRGLASLVFAVEAVDELGGDGDVVLSTVGVAVLLSVVAHGASARPLASRLARQPVTTGDRMPEEAMAQMEARPGWIHLRHRGGDERSPTSEDT